MFKEHNSTLPQQLQYTNHTDKNKQKQTKKPKKKQNTPPPPKEKEKFLRHVAKALMIS